jgi:hypothetical protein
MQSLAVLDLRVHGDCDAAQEQCHDDDPDRGQHPSTPASPAVGSEIVCPHELGDDALGEAEAPIAAVGE